MSHFTRLKTQLNDKMLVQRLAEKRGWTFETVETYTNPYTHNDVIHNATLLRDKDGKIKLAIDSEGNPVADSYYMGYEYETFIQEYAKEFLLSNLAGCFVQDEKTLENGDIVLHVAVL